MHKSQVLFPVCSQFIQSLWCQVGPEEEDGQNQVQEAPQDRPKQSESHRRPGLKLEMGDVLVKRCKKRNLKKMFKEKSS